MLRETGKKTLDEIDHTGAPHDEPVAARVFSAYILSRLAQVTLVEDPLYEYVPKIATYLMIQLDISRARAMLYDAFPGDLALQIERVLTGAPWTPEADMPARGFSP